MALKLLVTQLKCSQFTNGFELKTIKTFVCLLNNNFKIEPVLFYAVLRMMMSNVEVLKRIM